MGLKCVTRVTPLGVAFLMVDGAVFAGNVAPAHHLPTTVAALRKLAEADRDILARESLRTPPPEESCGECLAELPGDASLNSFERICATSDTQRDLAALCANLRTRLERPYAVCAGKRGGCATTTDKTLCGPDLLYPAEDPELRQVQGNATAGLQMTRAAKGAGAHP